MAGVNDNLFKGTQLSVGAALTPELSACEGHSPWSTDQMATVFKVDKMGQWGPWSRLVAPLRKAS